MQFLSQQSGDGHLVVGGRTGGRRHLSFRHTRRAIRPLGLLACAVLLCGATPTFAGLYNSSEPDEGKLGRDNFVLVFRDSLLRLRTIGMRQIQNDNPLRKRYLLLAALGARAAPSSLTVEQKMDLGAALVRSGKADEAVNLLEPLARREPKNFLVLSNLATAYQRTDQESRAVSTLEQALAAWPAQMDKVDEPFRAFLQSIGWHDKAFSWYREAETYQLKLLRLRAREGLIKKGKGDFQTVDALFDDGKSPPRPVRFVGESGKFEPGKLAADEKAKLPKDAIELVQQLLIWLPEDDRLYWLLGELYNAQGGSKNVRAARMIFDELAGFDGRGVRAPELAEHRKDLLNYHDSETDEVSTFDVNKKIDEEDKKRSEQATRIDWQTLGVGFGTGIAIAIFGMWQIQEIRRRQKMTR
jgi:tetratricopeptide (TPR) repeat protein